MRYEEALGHSGSSSRLQCWRSSRKRVENVVLEDRHLSQKYILHYD